MIKVGPMQLNQPEPLDPMEPFFTGTQPDGGYWQDASRLSAHDHSGGLLGNPVAVTIPDGSITTADLDPSVLAPYSLTDGSKPFTGQVTMQADAVVRDALLFGQQGTALAPDATLSRTGPQALSFPGTLTLGPPAAGQPEIVLRNADWARIYHDANFAIPVIAGLAGVALESPIGTRRMALAPTGTLTLTPDAGQAALAATMGSASFNVTPNATSTRLTTFGGNLEVAPAGTYFIPATDNATNNGYSSLRWAAVYAVNGTIQTSSAAVKEAVTPLDPAAAMEAVRNTEAVTFDYVAPERGPEWYDLPDDPEQAEQVLAQRLTAAPLEAAARHQAGFIAESCDPLFLVGEGQTSPGNSVGVLLAALQHIDQRLSALEGA